MSVTLGLAAALLVAILVLTGPVEAQTRATCENGLRIVNSSRHSLNYAEICRAGRKWVQKGFAVFVYLTSFAPETEKAWFDHLDEAEVSAGLISADPAIDDFRPNGLALELSTAANEDLGATITFGSWLFETGLDSGPGADRVKSLMVENIQGEEATSAFVAALDEAYAVTYPASRPPAIAAFAALAAVAGLAAGGLYLNRARINRLRRQLRLRRRVREAEKRVANLLVLLDHLLLGDSPEDSLLYRLFIHLGGGQYELLRDQARSAVDRGRSALSAVHGQWQTLAASESSLAERQVGVERVYLGLVGNSERSRALEDETLRAFVLPPSAELGADSRLQAEVVELQLAASRKLTMNPDHVDPEEEIIGVLDHIDDVQALLVRLVGAEEQAPRQLEEARTKYEAMTAVHPANFLLTAHQVFGGIEDRLLSAERSLEDERFLDCWDEAVAVMSALDVIGRFYALMDTFEAHRARIAAIMELGYRPPRLPLLESELAVDLQLIREAISSGRYEDAAPLLTSFEMTEQFALGETEAWQALHQRNQAAFARLKNEAGEWDLYQEEKSRPAWQKLGTYPQENWRDLDGRLDEAERLLSQIVEEQLPAAEELNSLEQGAFEEAETEMGLIGANLAQVGFLLQTPVSRLNEVEAAAEVLLGAIAAATESLAEAAALRDAQDPKIGPEIDDRLREAEAELALAREGWKKKRYLPGIRAQANAYRLAATALASAKKQVERIDDLLARVQALESEVAAEAQEQLAEAREMPPVMQTEAVRQAAKALAAQWSVAQIIGRQSSGQEDHPWADALERVVLAYQEAARAVEEARSSNQAAQAEYQRLWLEAQGAYRSARNAISAAERAHDRAAASGAGHAPFSFRGFLEKAYKSMPPEIPQEGATKEALARWAREARQAKEFAQFAERQAREVERQRQASRARATNTWSGWRGGSASGGPTHSSGARSGSSSGRPPSTTSSSASSSRSSGSTSSRRRR